MTKVYFLFFLIKKEKTMYIESCTSQSTFLCPFIKAYNILGLLAILHIKCICDIKEEKKSYIVYQLTTH